MTIGAAKNLLTKEELALKFRVSVSCINSWIQAGRITPIKIGRRALFPSDMEIVKQPKAKEVSLG